MDYKILFVDDEQHILSSYRRNFYKSNQIFTALGGEIALQLIESKGPFAVVVSDMRMPGMNGAELFRKIRDLDENIVRIMLTGHADISTVIEAINEGHIYRFLTKPCSPDHLKQAVDDGLRQYQLLKSEQELLNQTLRGSIKVLIELISVNNQQAYRHALKMRNYVKHLAEMKIVSNSWELDLAILLSRLGEITLPDQLMHKAAEKKALSEDEAKLLLRLPRISHDLIVNIPRLDSVAQAILYSTKDFNGQGFPDDSVNGQSIPLNARLIRILDDLVSLEEEGKLRREAFAIMHQRSGLYDPNLLNLVSGSVASISTIQQTVIKPRNISLNELEVGDQLLENIQTSTKQLLVLAGQEITPTLLMRIQNWSKLYTIKEPLTIAAREKSDEYDPGN